MEEVRNMYSKSEVGAFAQEKVAYLSNASQGECLLLIDQSHRISFHTGLKNPNIETRFILKPKASEIEEDNN